MIESMVPDASSASGRGRGKGEGRKGSGFPFHSPFPPPPPPPPSPTPPPAPISHPPPKLDALEREALVQALERHAGNRTRAAAELGIHRTTLIRKLKKLGIG